MRIVAVMAAALLLGAAAPLSPEEAYKANIADENKDYAEIPHAMLKIQDSVYLGEGDQAVLDGKKGDPASWRWATGPGLPKASGGIAVALIKGALAIKDARGKSIPA